jgi:hypothetical protein
MFTKAKKIEGITLTATEKKYAIELINQNKPEFIGVWVKCKNTSLMVEKINNDTYVLKTRMSQNLGALGMHYEVFESTIKLS